jgi:hypothetical protein
MEGKLARVKGENAGTYDINIGNVKVSDGNNGNNYIVAYNKGKFTITAKPPSNPTIENTKEVTTSGSTMKLTWDVKNGKFNSYQVIIKNAVGSVLVKTTLPSNATKFEQKGVFAGYYTTEIIGKYDKGSITKTVSLKVALNASKTPVQFSDIQNLPTAYQTAINWMGKYAITTGDGKGHYQPNDSITREQMAIFLWKLAGQPPQTKADVTLYDIGNLGAVSQKAIKWLASTGITTGDGKGHYKPADNVTREQMALFMWKLSGQDAKVGSNSMKFSDISSLGKVSQQAINWVASYNITVGNGKGGYLPKDNVTRGQMALFMSKLGSTLKNY